MSPQNNDFNVFRGNLSSQGQVERSVVEEGPYKRKCRTWTFEGLGEDKRYCKEEGDKTLELFPLHPEGKMKG